ncbi:MAG: hypothetical protein JOZ48_07490 [Acidobacteriaceae bacterium]|nr:hypothetical protein [Acidobacteriaceae bacterium]MBV9764672.1 hypothetical protein [Acidobacteriaceae bacterium]
MSRLSATFIAPIALLALSCIPLRADAIQLGFNGDAQLQSGNVAFFGQFPNGAPYVPSPGSFGVHGKIQDRNNPSYTQNFFGGFSLTFAGDTVAQVMQSTVETPFSATVGLTAPPLPPSTPTAPKPGSILLLGSGLLAFGVFRFRRHRRPEAEQQCAISA